MLINKFMRGMRKTSHSIDKMFTLSKTSITVKYNSMCSILSNDAELLLDIGSGENMRFKCNCEHIISDIDIAGIEQNEDTGLRLIFDINNGLPFKDNSVSIITSCFVLEHIAENEFLINEIARVLKDNGSFVSLFAAKYAEYSIINRLLPEKLKKSLLNLTMNEDAHKHGYSTYYNYCSSKEIKRILKKHLKLTSLEVNYFSAPYFDFFPPLYFLFILYESILYHLDLKELASYVLISSNKINE